MDFQFPKFGCYFHIQCKQWEYKPLGSASSIPSHCRPEGRWYNQPWDTDAGVQLNPSVMSNGLWPHGLQHARLPCPSPVPGACSNSGSSSQWCHPTISSSVVPFSSCLKWIISVFLWNYEWMLLNCGVGEDSWESLGLQGDPTSPF